MTAKEYLSQLKDYRRSLKAMELQMQEIYLQASQIKAIRYDKDRVQSSVSSSAMEQCLIRLEEIGNQYATKIIQYRAEVAKREGMIDSMDKKIYVHVLRLVYINGLSLSQTADVIGKSWRHTARLHGWALEQFKKKYADVIECHS